MEKLYPPVIEGTIPAFYGTTLVVPFSMNRSVAKSDIKGFIVKIKTIQTNTFVANIESKDYDTGIARFDISSANLTAGQYYKIQLAYVGSDSTIGHYSMVGVVKYYGLEGPKIYIDGLSNKRSNLYAGYYLGVFEHDDDPMEKIAQYRFVITYSGSDEVFYDTGWLLHSSINDADSLSANDIFKYTDDLEDDTAFYIQYQVITSNKMECASPKYNIMQKDSVGTELKFEFVAKADYDNGFVRLNLKSLGKDGENATLTGAFEISRQNTRNPRHWEVIDSFVLQNEVATKTFWRDFTVTHGETYKYAVRQFNEAGVYTNRVISNEVFVDFEDAYLFDGKRQLKIRYNPKVSSFKNDIPETKTDTIGSKYPFIFRNGHVNYKEFPISGLISYFSDEQELFLTNEEIGIIDTTNWERDDTPTEKEIPDNAKTTDLTNYNIAAERKFKLEVLEWLTDGKAKLFRSPAEGNYIVRLLNTSLTPNDTVGRMLHTFSCTAYEVAECTYDNLVAFGFIENGLNDNDKYRQYYRTVPLGWQTHEGDEEKYDVKYIPIITGKNPDYPMDENGYIELLKDPYSSKTLHAYAIYFDDMNSGDSIWINGEQRLIGNTGQFILEKADDINSVKIKAIEDIAYFHQDEYNEAMEEYEEDSNNLQFEITKTEGLLELANAQLEQKQEAIEDFYINDPSIAIDEGVIAYNNEIRVLNSQINEKKAERDIENSNLDNIDSQLSDVQRQITAKNEQINAKRAQIAGINSQIQTANQDIQNQQILINNKNTEIINKQNQIAAKQEEINSTTSYVADLKGMTTTAATKKVNDTLAAKTEALELVNRYDAVLNTYINQFVTTKQTRDSLLGELQNNYNFGMIDLNNENKDYMIVKTVPSNSGGASVLVIQAIDTRVNSNTTTINSDNSTITSQKNSIPKKTPDINTRDECQSAIDNYTTIINQNINSFLIKKDQFDNDPDNSDLELELISIAETILANQEKKAEYEGYLEQYAEKYDIIEEKQAEVEKLTKENTGLTSIKNQLLSNESPYANAVKEVVWAISGITPEIGGTASNPIAPRLPKGYTIQFVQNSVPDIEIKRLSAWNSYVLANNAYEDAVKVQTDKKNVNTIERSIQILEVEKQLLQEELSDLQEELVTLQNRLDFLETFNDIQAQQAEIRRLEQEIVQLTNELDPLYRKRDSTLPTQKQEILQRINAITGQINSLEQQIATKEEEKEAYILTIENDTLKTLRQEKTEIEKRIQNLERTLNRLLNGNIPQPQESDYVYSDGNTQNYILEDYNGLFTYKYTDLYANSFDLIAGQTLVDYPCRQFIGGEMDRNILNDIVDTRTELLDVLQIHADLKQIEDIYTWADASAFDIKSMTYEEFNNWFSFDKTKMPGANKGYSYGEMANQVFNPQRNSMYIYKIHPIFNHNKEYQIDADVPHNYVDTLAPWELEELRSQVVEMLSKYNLTLAQVSDFVKYRNNDATTVIYQDEKKTMIEIMKIIKLIPEDYLLLEKYYGKEEFNYSKNEDPLDWHPEVLIVYENGVWVERPVEYHKNELYYVDANYYKVNQFTKSLDNYNWESEYFKKNKLYYEKQEDGTYNAINDITVYLKNYEALNPSIDKEDITPYKLGLYEKTAYKNYDKYRTFEDDYYLIYDEKEGYYKVVDGYSSRIYINTGETEGVEAVKDELYTKDGRILQPYVDLANTGSFKTNLIPDITDIYVGDGVILNLSYQVREIKYIVEETSPELKEKRAAWDEAVKNYTDLFYTRKDTAAELYDYKDEDWRTDYDKQLQASKFYRGIIAQKEEEYLACLDEKIKRYKEDRGIE